MAHPVAAPADRLLGDLAFHFLPDVAQAGPKPAKLTIGEGAIRLATLSAVIALSISGASGGEAPSASSRALGTDARVYAPDTTSGVAIPVPAGLRTAPETCPAATRAVRFYAARVAYWQTRLGVPKMSTHRGSRCPQYLAKVLQRKAYALRAAYARFEEYHYHWWKWLPDKWQRIGACETGYGRRPGNWRHSNSSYEGAFGFAKSSWDAFKYRADPKAGPYPQDAWQATPRQQYEVALAIYGAYGFSGWGCRGA